MEKTRQAIQDAYISLLLEKKTGKITISEVARKANIDRKTFYLHYDSIEDILRNFCRNMIHELVEEAHRIHFSPQTFSIRVLLEALNRQVEENMDFFRFICLNREYDFFFDEIKELMIDGLMASAQDGMPFSADELKLYADYFLSGIISAYVRWIREEQPIPIEQLAELVQQSAYGGIQAVLGESPITP